MSHQMRIIDMTISRVQMQRHARDMSIIEQNRRTTGDPMNESTHAIMAVRPHAETAQEHIRFLLCLSPYAVLIVMQRALYSHMSTYGSSRSKTRKCIFWVVAVECGKNQFGNRLSVRAIKMIEMRAKGESRACEYGLKITTIVHAVIEYQIYGTALAQTGKRRTGERGKKSSEK